MICASCGKRGLKTVKAQTDVGQIYTVGEVDGSPHTCTPKAVRQRAPLMATEDRLWLDAP